jgi:hypothetical protein
MCEQTVKWYIDSLSFWLDLGTFAAKIWEILKCVDINQPGIATMEEFIGNGAKYIDFTRRRREILMMGVSVKWVVSRFG